LYVGDRIHHCYKHKGWVTALSSLAEARAFFSSGNDSTLVTYNGEFHNQSFYLGDFIYFFSAIGTVIDKLNIGSVIYTICFHSRLKQVIFGIPEGKSII